MSQAGCDVFIIHARKAWLNGLSPKQNREIPPLRYEVVHAIKHDFPHLTIVLNGGIKQLAQIEQKIFSCEPHQRSDVIHQFIPYIEQQLSRNIKLSSITRHILGLYQGQKGARMWRRHLSENAHLFNADVEVIKEALSYVRNDT